MSRGTAGSERVEQGRGVTGPTIDAEAAAVLRAAVTNHQQGRLGDAAKGYEQFLVRHPNHADALNLSGYLAHQMGDHQKALERIQRSIALTGDNPHFLFNLGKVFHAIGRLDEAAEAYERSLRLNPKELQVHFNLAVLCEAKDLLEPAAQHYKKIIGTDPKNLPALTNLGNLEWKRGRAETAEGLYRQVLAIDPRASLASSNLASILWQNGDHDGALTYFKESLRADATSPSVWQKIGALLAERGNLDEAIQATRRALELDSDNPVLLSDLGYFCFRLGDANSALAFLDRSLAIRPGHVETLNTQAVVLQFMGQVSRGAAACEEAIAKDPEFAAVYSTLATIYKDSGDLEPALACFEQAAVLAPDNPVILSNKILAMHYSAGISNDTIWSESQKWDSLFGSGAGQQRTAHRNSPDPRRRLRIGYFSPDFRRHSVAYLFEPILAAHNRNEVEIFCYAELTKADDLSARLEGLSDHWRMTFGLEDDEVVQCMRRDRIDILVDLAGHTASNRLPIFARKPAPVQVTWLGYPNTTGLRTIDYRLSDAISDPPGDPDRQHSETIVRLPNGVHCYAPPSEAPPVGPLPASAASHVTFGSFNSLAKVTPGAIDTWSAVLAAVPESQLVMKSMAFSDQGTRDRITRAFAGHGIGQDRLTLAAFIASTEDHLGAHGQLDIALDTFPYNGTATTCEAFWMGVPVVTLRADRHAGRVGASLLTRVGLDNLIADTTEQFVVIAAALAADLGSLAELRAGLRDRVAASPLCDAAGFTNDLEAAYRTMWRRWCASQRGR